MQKINSRRDKERQKADDKGCSSQRRKKNCITEEFSKNRPKEFSSIDSLDMLYQQLKPTAKKIIKNIQSEADTDQARNVEDHLNRYLKCMNVPELKLWLQFVTGGDVMPTEAIILKFIPEQIPRAPVVRTCVPQLELSLEYSSYNELAQDFSSILNNRDSFSFLFG